MNYVPDRGDVIWINFDPQAGHEQAQFRPALVLSPKAYNAVASLALLCPISTKIKGYRFEVPLAKGMSTSGVILSDQVRSFDWRARRARFEETAPADLIDEVLARIAPLLGL